MSFFKKAAGLALLSQSANAQHSGYGADSMSGTQLAVLGSVTGGVLIFILLLVKYCRPQPAQPATAPAVPEVRLSM
jgi:hypothetical protein